MGTDPPVPSLDLRTPWMNAAGSLGFAPDPYGDIDLQNFGAFVTNPISVRGRQVAQGPRLLSFPGGVLIHTGHPNPGLRTAIKESASAWARAALPIILHLLSTEPKQLRNAVVHIEELDNVIAIELSLDVESSIAEAEDAIHATAGELPLIAQIALNRIGELSDAAINAGATAISLGPPRGTLAGPDGKLISGRLYGPALYPQALAAVEYLSNRDLPVIAACGVETKQQGDAMFAAGALAVQMDIALWKPNTGT